MSYDDGRRYVETMHRQGYHDEKIRRAHGRRWQVLRRNAILNYETGQSAANSRTWRAPEAMA